MDGSSSSKMNDRKTEFIYSGGNRQLENAKVTRQMLMVKIYKEWN